MSDSSRLEQDDTAATHGADSSSAMPSSRDTERVSVRQEEQETGEAGNTTTAYVPALKGAPPPPATSSSSTPSEAVRGRKYSDTKAIADQPGRPRDCQQALTTLSLPAES